MRYSTCCCCWGHISETVSSEAKNRCKNLFYSFFLFFLIKKTDCFVIQVWKGSAKEKQSSCLELKPASLCKFLLWMQQHYLPSGKIAWIFWYFFPLQEIPLDVATDKHQILGDEAHEYDAGEDKGITQCFMKSQNIGLDETSLNTMPISNAFLTIIWCFTQWMCTLGLVYRLLCDYCKVKIILQRIISVVWWTDFLSEIWRLTKPRWWG